MYRYIGMVLGVLLDQATKSWAESSLETPWIIWSDWVSLELVFNYGIAFSLPLSRWVSVGLSLAVVLYILYLCNTNPKESKKYGYYFLVSGALGNLIDRIIWGRVTDFISILDFPIFNIADVLVFVGVVWLLYEDLATNTTSRQPQ